MDCNCYYSLLPQIGEKRKKSSVPMAPTLVVMFYYYDEFSPSILLSEYRSKSILYEFYRYHCHDIYDSSAVGSVFFVSNSFSKKWNELRLFKYAFIADEGFCSVESIFKKNHFSFLERIAEENPDSNGDDFMIKSVNICLYENEEAVIKLLNKLLIDTTKINVSSNTGFQASVYNVLRNMGFENKHSSFVMT